MRSDCPVCRSEGFGALERVVLRCRDRTVIATLFQVTSELLAQGDAGLSESAWKLLGAREGDVLEVSHPEALDSLRSIRAKAYGQLLDARSLYCC